MDDPITETVERCCERSSPAAHGYAALAKEVERLLREARAERAQFTAERKNWPTKQFYNGMEHALVELQRRIERREEAPHTEKVELPPR